MKISDCACVCMCVHELMHKSAAGDALCVPSVRLGGARHGI